jgi:hypothetical protein
MRRASDQLAVGDSHLAVESAVLAFQTARTQRSHGLVSSTWMFLLDTMAADPDAPLSTDYREYVEGAFSWAETMPDEIQVWFFPALIPHLDRLALHRLVDRATARAAMAQQWIDAGNINVKTRAQAFHIDDLAAGRSIDPRALAVERSAVFYADEGYDPTGATLDHAASLWRKAGREDRAIFLEDLAETMRSLG